MHPILVRIGPLQLPTYGFLLALALLVGIYVAVRLGRREGLDTGQIVDFSTWLIISGLIGAKIYMILTGWGFYVAHPGQILSLSTLEAGGGFYGGFIGATLFAIWYVRRHRWPMLKVFDVFAPAVAIGQCIGRVGCFSAGDDYGKAAYHSPLAVVFTSHYANATVGVPLGIPLYPVQLFESVLCLVIFAVLIIFYRHKKRDGQIFVMYMMLYAVARFFLEYYRGDPDRGFFFNHTLSTAQLCAIVLFALGIFLAYRLRLQKKPSRPERELRVQEARARDREPFGPKRAKVQ